MHTLLRGTLVTATLALLQQCDGQDLVQRSVEGLGTISKLVSLSDGSIAFRDETVPNQWVIRHYDPDLQADWAFVAPTPSLYLSRGLNGSLHLCEDTIGLTTFPPTPLVHSIIRTLDASGTITSSRVYTVDVFPLDPFGSQLTGPLKVDAQGNSFWSWNTGSSGRRLIAKINSAGIPQWAVSFEYFYANLLVPDGLGGCYLAESNPTLSTETRIAHLDADGGLSFFKKYAYSTGHSLYAQTIQLVDGELWVFLAHEGPVSVLRLGVEGQPLGSHLYTLGPSTHLFLDQAGRTSEGRTLLVGAVSGSRSLLIELNDDGTVSTAAGWPTTTTNGYQTSTSLAASEVAPEAAYCIGQHRSENLAFEITETTPFLWRIPSTPQSGCGATPMEVSTMELEASQISSEDLPLPLTTHYITMSDHIDPLVAATTFPSADYCSLVTGVEDVSSTLPESLITLNGNALRSGDALTLRTHAAGSFFVTDATGRMVVGTRPSAASAAHQVTTEGLAAGLFHVTFITQDGRRQSLPFVVAE